MSFKEVYEDVRTVKDYNGDLIFEVGDDYIIKSIKSITIPPEHLKEEFDGIIAAAVIFEKKKGKRIPEPYKRTAEGVEQ